MIDVFQFISPLCCISFFSVFVSLVFNFDVCLRSIPFLILVSLRHLFFCCEIPCTPGAFFKIFLRTRSRVPNFLPNSARCLHPNISPDVLPNVPRSIVANITPNIFQCTFQEQSFYKFSRACSGSSSWACTRALSRVICVVFYPTFCLTFPRACSKGFYEHSPEHPL